MRKACTNGWQNSTAALRLQSQRIVSIFYLLIDGHNTGVQEWHVDMATGARHLRLHGGIFHVLPGPYPAVYQQCQGC